MNRRLLILGIVVIVLLIIQKSSSSSSTTPNYLQIVLGLAEKKQHIELQQMLLRYEKALIRNEEQKQYIQFLDSQERRFYIINAEVAAKIQQDIRKTFRKAKVELSLGTTSSARNIDGYDYLKYFDIRVEAKNITIENIAFLLELLEKNTTVLFLHNLEISSDRHSYEKIGFKAIIRAYAIGDNNE